MRLTETQMGVLMVMGLGGAELTGAAAGLLNIGGNAGGFLASIIMPFAPAPTNAMSGTEAEVDA